MRFSRQATSAAVASSSMVQFVSTFFIAAAAIHSAPVASSRTNELDGSVDTGMLRSSSISSSHGLGGAGSKHFLGSVLVGGGGGGGGGGRELEGICGPSGHINCVNGMVESSYSSVPPITCSEACLPNYSSSLPMCCIGTDACSGTTAKICKDADSPSCSGTNACKDATIPYIVNSCKGDSACEKVGFVGGGAPANTVGNFTDSCHTSKACFKAAYGGEGGLGDLDNSCTASQACQALGAGMFGIVTSDMTDCCATTHECSGNSEANLPVQCKAGAVAPTQSPTKSGLCPFGYIDCVNGMVESSYSSVPPITCSDACSSTYSEGSPPMCCIGTDACSGTTAKICKDAVSPSCSGKNACKDASIPYIVNSCKGDSACEMVGAVGGGAPANTVGKFTNSCHAFKACFKAAYGGEGGLGDLENSCTASQACQALGAGIFGLVTSDMTDCCATPHECSGYSEAILPVQCKDGAVTPTSSPTGTNEPTLSPSTKKPTQSPTSTKKPTQSPTTKANKKTPTPTKAKAPKKETSANLFD